MVADLIDTSTTGSPGWWLARLQKKLESRKRRYDVLDSYYDNTAGIPTHATEACREAYRRLIAISRTNFAELIVESVRERMTPTGFRTGAEGDDLGDAEAWRIWQGNSLDADSMLVHRASLSMGDAYVIVGPVDDEIEVPLITPEDPREVITEADPSCRRRTRAALKLYTDEAEGIDVAYVHLPGFVARATRPHRRSGVDSEDRETPAASAADWTWDDEGEETGIPVVPVVRFANRANMFGRSKGEFETHLPILDRINFNVVNRLEIVSLQAFRQRAVKGVPTHDPAGNEIDYDEIFRPGPGALWHLPEAAEMWESGQVDLGPIHTSSRDDILDLAAVSGTPLFYLTPDAANGSAEGASLARERLVFKCGDRILQATESWEAVMSTAFMFAGDETRARRRDMEVLWAPPERFSLAERADAASKAGAAGVPWRTVMTDIMQFSPQQVDRMEAERATDAFLGTPTLPPVANDALAR